MFIRFNESPQQIKLANASVRSSHVYLTPYTNDVQKSFLISLNVMPNSKTRVNTIIYQVIKQV
jgi:hypothetical protein